MSTMEDTMRAIYKGLIMAGILLALAACAASPIKQVEGQTVYTQLNLWVDGQEHLTTNYKVGWRLPVNSKVQIGDTSGDGIEVRAVDSGRSFTIANVEGYTKQDIAGIYNRYFAATPRDLDGFSRAQTAAIRNGDITAGMSKAAVLVARGYPPAHETPSTQADDWKYWTSRFDTVVVSFRNGQVSEISD